MRANVTEAPVRRDSRVAVRLVRRASMVLLAAAAACAGLLAGAGAASAGVGSVSATVRTAAIVVNWGVAEKVPGLAALNAGGSASVSSVVCWRAGDCAAGGSYTDAKGHGQAFVVDETNSVWGRAEEVPGTAKLDAGGGASVNTISCAPRGGCAAGGFYHDSKGNQQAFVVGQVDGKWRAATAVPGLAKLNVGGLAGVNSISCPSAGNCGAAGGYQTYNPPGTGDNSFQVYVVSERNGRWSQAETVPGISSISPPPDENNNFGSIACASAGNCAAGGSWWGIPCSPGSAICPHGFVTSDVSGRWRSLVQPKDGGPVSSIACWQAGDCLAVGTLDPNGSTNPPAYMPFAETEKNGRWGTARLFPALPGAIINTLSCPAATYCVMAGTFGYDSSGDPEGALVLREKDGHWSAATSLTGPAGPSAGHPGGSVGTLSCASVGNCGAGGSDVTGQDENGNFTYAGYVAGERDGRWPPSEEPPGLAALSAGGNSGVSSLSCAAANTCSAGGYYTDAAGHQQAWVDGEK